MSVMYVSFWSKGRPRTFGCVVMGSTVFFMLRSRMLLYSAGPRVNRVQVVLSGFSVTLYGCVVSVCCVGFASLDVVCDVLHDCA